MKKIVKLLILFSRFCITAEKSPTEIVQNVHNFLNQFQVARRSEETKENFINRLENDNSFDQINLLPFSLEKNFKKNNSLTSEKIEDGKVLHLFKSNLVAVKQCGFWANEKSRFYVASRTELFDETAHFIEMGSYEWRIEFQDKNKDLAFKDTPIQDLLKYLFSCENDSVYIPLKNINVSFLKEPNMIIARLKYS